MQLYTEDFPIVRMRNPIEGSTPNEVTEQEMFLELLDRNEPFVIIVERMPKLTDIQETKPEDRKQRAKVIKAHKANIIRLCAGMIVIGQVSNVAVPVVKIISGFTAAMGVKLYFADDEKLA